MRPRTTIATLAFVIAASRDAAAQSAGDEATARALFDEGRRLMDQGNLTVACAKLEEGQRLSPGIGMKYNLADCYERLGKLASAWAAYLDVAATARAAGQSEREAAARRRARALEADLLRLQIDVVTAGRVAGLEVKRDGTLVGPGQWGSAIPADPGEHVVTATAPGRKKFEARVTLSGSAGTVEKITVPLLDVDPRSTEKPTIAVARPQPRSQARLTIGYVAGATGLAGIAAGAAFGLIAMNKYSQSSSYCYPGNLCLSKGVALREDAIVAGNVSTIAFIVGGALVVTGAALILTAPSGSEPGRGARWLSPLLPQGASF